MTYGRLFSVSPAFDIFIVHNKCIKKKQRFLTVVEKLQLIKKVEKVDCVEVMLMLEKLHQISCMHLWHTNHFSLSFVSSEVGHLCVVSFEQ